MSFLLFQIGAYTVTMKIYLVFGDDQNTGKTMYHFFPLLNCLWTMKLDWKKNSFNVNNSSKEDPISHGTFTNIKLSAQERWFIYQIGLSVIYLSTKIVKMMLNKRTYLPFLSSLGILFSFLSSLFSTGFFFIILETYHFIIFKDNCNSLQA